MNIKEINFQLDRNNPEHHRILTEMALHAAIFDEEMVQEPYKIDKRAEENFVYLIYILTNMQEKGILTFEYNDLLTPFETHEIRIKWNLQDGDLLSMTYTEAKTFLSAISKDKTSDFNIFVIQDEDGIELKSYYGFQIYKPA